MSQITDWDMTKTYVRVFGTRDGRVVLKDILADLGHFSTAESSNEMVLQNYAKLLLYKIGAYLDEHEDALVEQYVSFPVPEGKKENN